MKNIFSLLLIDLSTTAIAQPEKARDIPAPPPLSLEEMQLPPVREPDMYMTGAEQVKNAINADPNMIMGNTSESMRMLYPGNTFAEYIKDFKKENGEMREFRFLNLSGSIARYEVTFDKNKKMLMKLGMDDNGRLSLLNFSPYKPEHDIAILERNTTTLSLPFTGEWYVLSGGIADPNNRNSNSFENRGAVTFAMQDAQKKTFKTNGAQNEDYYAFGQPVLAPCDATVVRIIDNINDNDPGSVNTMFAGGNTVILKTDKSEYIVLGHLKDGSIKIKEGDKIKKGATLAQCGNSGASKQPSLYFNIQNTDGTQPATGAKAIFSNVTSVMPDGKTEKKQSYTPMMGGKVKS